MEEALINRFGCLALVPKTFKLRSDNGLVFCSKIYTSLVKVYGLSQEFITPYTPQQNGMVERLIRTIKEQCVYHHRFKKIRHAERTLADWIRGMLPVLWEKSLAFYSFIYKLKIASLIISYDIFSVLSIIISKYSKLLININYSTTETNVNNYKKV